MKLPLTLFFIALLAGGLLAAEKSGAAAALTDEDRAKLTFFFEHEVRPLLAKRCFECHGEKKQKGGLRLVLSCTD